MFCWGDGRNVFNSSLFLYIYLYLFDPFILIIRLNYLRDNSLLQGYHPNPATLKLQHTSKQEQLDQCGDTIEKSQAPDDGCINVWNMLSIEEVK